MELLPTIWGRHNIAQIEAIVVRGRLITSILDAPEQWGERLSSIGFRRSPQSWLRLGSMSTSEYQFISPEISLVGLRPENVIDLPEDQDTLGFVPYDVKDALLGLWQRQVGSVLVALSMEHGQHFTRSQAWSLVETALEGGVTPETETLLGLTFTKMSRDGAMSPPALAFAESLGWQGASNAQPIDESRVLLGRGESVQWADNEGVVISGRLAQRVTQSAKGCWVFKDSPVWAGGYVVSSPLWIKREQLQFTGWAPDWLESDLVESTQVNLEYADTFVIRKDAIVMNSAQRQVLGSIINVDRIFPSLTWRESFASIMESSIARSHGELDVDYEATLKWLEDFESRLMAVTRLFYGSDPLRFAITGSAGSMSLALCVGAGMSLERSKWLPDSALITSDLIDLDGIAADFEAMRFHRESQMRDSAARLSETYEIEGLSLPSGAFPRNQQALWPAIAQHYKGHVTNDALFRIQSVLVSHPDLADTLLNGAKKQVVSEALTADFVRRPQLGMGNISLEMQQYTSEIYPVEGLTWLMAQGDLSVDWQSQIARTPSVQYQTRVNLSSGDPIIGLDKLKGVASFVSGKRLSASTETDLQVALTGYSKALELIARDIDESSHARISDLREIARTLPLMGRFERASLAVSALPIRQVETYVESELRRRFQSAISGWSDPVLSRYVTRISNELRKPGGQGVAVFINNRSTIRPVRSFQIVLTDRAASQSRTAEIQGSTMDLKKYYRMTGTAVGIDSISLIDPELCILVNGDQSASTLARQSNIEGGAYVDTGVVAGFAMKDIRGFDRKTLIDHATRMNDQQKAKYLTKDLIWPRKSFEEMKEQGIGLMVAFTHDLLWRSVPRLPKSTSRQHVDVFLNTLMNIKDAVEPVFAGMQNKDRINSPDFAGFAYRLHLAVTEASADVPDITSVYSVKDRYVRGYDLRWDTFNVATSAEFGRKTYELSWSDVLKEKRVSKPSPVSKVLKGDIVREGPDYRDGRSVSGEDFIKTFGFSGIEYGMWTSQEEREKHMNFAFDSMMDFANLLEWEPMSLSLGGKLGLCIGSRGRGGKNPAVAHFEPANMAINLTKMKGAGNLAHEYSHAVANHYGRLATGSPQDVTETFAYALQRPGPVPAPPQNGMRPMMREAFHKLMVAIMRAPEEGSDTTELGSYTSLSKMLTASVEEDKGRKEAYWSSPGEMFARAMEAWFKNVLTQKGERNDYLVWSGDYQASDLYPDSEHLARIGAAVEPWLESVVQEVREVEHPFLGNIQMPILNTEHRSVVPLSVSDLCALAKNHLEQTFRQYSPNLMLVEDNLAKAGLYHLARDLIVLNAACADSNTFHHESWHACHEKLLTGEERQGLADLFDVKSAFASKVVSVMEAEGFSQTVINHALSDQLELQAYAYQLWIAGALRFDESDAFYKARGFVEGVLIAGDLFGPKEAEMLFTKFMTGELAERKSSNESQRIMRGVELVSGEDPLGWDDSNTLFWDPSETHAAGGHPSMRMG